MQRRGVARDARTAARCHRDPGESRCLRASRFRRPGKSLGVTTCAATTAHRADLPLRAPPRWHRADCAFVGAADRAVHGHRAPRRTTARALCASARANTRIVPRGAHSSSAETPPRRRLRRLIDAAEFRQVLATHGAVRCFTVTTTVARSCGSTGRTRKFRGRRAFGSASTAHHNENAGGYNLFQIAAEGDTWRCEMIAR